MFRLLHFIFLMAVLAVVSVALYDSVNGTKLVTMYTWIFPVTQIPQSTPV